MEKVEEAKSIEDFIEKAMELNRKIIKIQPYISSDEKFPCLRMESKNLIYERAIDKKFLNLEDAEDFIEKLSFELGRELNYLGFIVGILSLEYRKKCPKAIEEEDIKYLFHLGYYRF